MWRDAVFRVHCSVRDRVAGDHVLVTGRNRSAGGSQGFGARGIPWGECGQPARLVRDQGAGHQHVINVTSAEKELRMQHSLDQETA